MYICFNGQFYPAYQSILKAGNPGFKWGDGLFETIKLLNGKIQLASFHFERLFSGLGLLGISHSLNEGELSNQIVQLCKKNKVEERARVRLAVYRQEDGSAGTVMEAKALSPTYDQWNETGLRIDIYPFARKSQDAFSSLKSASFLPYVMASRYAKEQGLDDVLVLNSEGKIADSSRANLFLIINQQLFTPSLHQGCVAGVTRRHLIETLKATGTPVHQAPITEEELLSADEVFLTNALQGMKWVGTYKDRQYICEQSLKIYNELFK